MVERLSGVEARIGSVRQLSTIVTAMRGIAVAHSREARQHLAGVRTYADAIGVAIGEALSLLPASPATVNASGGEAVVAFCTEQGFAGTFNERVLDAVEAFSNERAGHPPALLLVGDRGLMIAGERGLAVEWSAPMIAHVDEAAQLAERIIDALYDRLEAGAISEVTVIHTALAPAGRIDIVTKRLIPFDYQRFQLARLTEAPLITLPPQRLLEGLAQEYVFAELCEAVIISFAAENEARTRAMIAAKDNVSRKLDDLTALARQLRQEEITNEVIELADQADDPAGPTGARASSGRSRRTAQDRAGPE
ncbi:F0F1 ATP synthase subunit gamma [Ciceribacter sp. RN22]|uniref:F0F1 ATP synthase subunit gamma n=1 Tax=Ciceribacter sp. RN22 TaxID=2954932 RepID=UPI00209354F2|nr:FoF1 ATP synthase subunit gamma [Ciceribacter sp. RN22]MCO6179387.1 F0F1 ATP synthase subunit gamma [Ciceribacter sp. RN22]